VTPTAPPRFVNQYLGYLLGQANHALFKGFDAAVQAAGLTTLEWRVLAALHDSPALPVSQLAQDVLSKQPTVTKLLQRMAAQDWVSLQDCPHDQRRTLVSITPAGAALVIPLIKQSKQHEAQALQALSATEIKAFKTLLHKLAQTP
jgi:DNA-binding MarR family transcriptional regulator